MVELREKLKGYKEFILQVHQMNTVPSPQPSQLSALEDWLRDFRGGNPFLQSNEAFTWADPNPSSYLCLSAPVKETDPCTTFITEKILRTYRHLLGHCVNTGQAVDTDTGYTFTDARIGVTAGFMALFALVIAVFSDAKRIEVFAATATYVDLVSGIHRVND
ncbi:hypothetical protein QC762_0083030 [Podospora pseudocomata]|uniref:DUF6594 domain-containing protein n=1 Tax=Podospora pseudocomata TaxID=2093779 RepID=A0ABR0GCA9_9PEZI|nr:hypothetical protein QC762_0083030 [Podospora pseudocomata]